MKKLLVFGLIALLFAVVQSLVPTNSVPFDNDVGYAYVINADQIQPDIMIADNSNPLYFSDYAVPVYPDVGSLICTYAPISYQEILWQNIEPTLYSTNATYNQAIKAEWLLRTDNGERQPRGGAMPGHI